MEKNHDSIMGSYSESDIDSIYIMDDFGNLILITFDLFFQMASVFGRP